VFHRKEIATQLVKKEYVEGFAISLQEYGCNPKITPNYPFDAEEIKELLQEQLVNPLFVQLNSNFRKFYQRTSSE
jgi:hypothetical protein